METYHVPVRNESTGEIRVMEISSGHVTDAQVEALQRIFREEGWRQATALLPQIHHNGLS